MENKAALLDLAIRADFSGKVAFQEGQGFLSGARGKVQDDQETGEYILFFGPFYSSELLLEIKARK